MIVPPSPVPPSPYCTSWPASCMRTLCPFHSQVCMNSIISFCTHIYFCNCIFILPTTRSLPSTRRCLFASSHLSSALLAVDIITSSHAFVLSFFSTKHFLTATSCKYNFIQGTTWESGHVTTLCLRHSLSS